MNKRLILQTVLRKRTSLQEPLDVVYYRCKIFWAGLSYTTETSSFLSVDRRVWCSTSQRLKTKDENSIRTNRQVEKHVNAIKDTFDEFKVVHETFEPATFKNLVYKIVNPTKCKEESLPFSARSIFDDYLQKYGNSFGDKRVQRYKFVQKMLGDFLDQQYRNRFANINVLDRELYC